MSPPQQVEMGEISRKLGLRIKELREKRGLTQLKLAEILNMEASNLSKIERGVQIPKEESLEKIAAALDVEVRELFNYGYFENKKDLIAKIDKILEKADTQTVQKYYRLLINL